MFLLAPLAFAVATLAASEGTASVSDTLFVRVDSEPLATVNASATDSTALAADSTAPAVEISPAQDTVSQDSAVTVPDTAKVEVAPVAKDETAPKDTVQSRPQVQVSIGSLLAAQSKKSNEKELHNRKIGRASCRERV